MGSFYESGFDFIVHIVHNVILFSVLHYTVKI